MIAAVGVHFIEQVKPEPEISPDSNPPLASEGLKEATTRIGIHQQRAGLWFLVAIIAVLLSGTFAIPVVASTAWATWLINWQSNLLFYFAGASVILSLLNGVRASLLHRHVKRSLQGK